VTRRLTRALAAVTAFTAAAALSAVVAPAGRAATPNDPSRLALVAQDAYTPLGGIFHAELQIGPSGTPGLQLSVIVHQAVPTRSAFADTAADKTLGGVLAAVPVPVDSLTVSPDGTRPVAIGLAAPGGAFDPARLAVHLAGVYPLEIELRDAQDQPLSRFVTYLVAVDVNASGQPQPLTARLGVSWVWPLDAHPSVRPDGSTDPAVAAALEPPGRLGRQVLALQRHPAVPVVLAPTPETLDTWGGLSLARGDPGAANDAATLRSLLGLGRAQVLTGPYVSLDLPSLLRFGLGGAVDPQFVQGGVVVDKFFGTHVDGRTALAQPVDSDALGRLRARGVDRVVVDETAVGAQNDRLTVTAPFSVEPASDLAPAGPIAAVANDTRLADLLSGDGTPALRAQRFLAGLSLTALETPASTRAVVVVNPSGFDPPAALLDAVLGGLTNHPWLAPMTLDQVFTTVPPPSGNAVRPLAAGTATPAPPVSATTYDETQARLASFGSLVGPTDPRVARAERLLLSSVSSDWSGPAGAAQARSELIGVNAIIDDFLSRIRVPTPSTITLTARSGAIPITFRNDTGQPVRVLVSLRSHKLDFPRGSTQTVALPPRSVTVRFDVRSRTSGTFPLDLSVRSADGSLPIAEGRFKVQSTVVSTVGIALAAGAAFFLAAWWIFEIRRRRRARAGTRA
jgi:hypothetical protein